MSMPAGTSAAQRPMSSRAARPRAGSPRNSFGCNRSAAHVERRRNAHPPPALDQAGCEVDADGPVVETPVDVGTL